MRERFESHLRISRNFYSLSSKNIRIFFVVYLYFRHMHQSDLEEHADIGGDTCYTMDDRGTRKYFFKKRSTSSTCAVRNKYAKDARRGDV